MGGNNHPRIAVVGGGIFGSFAAYFLCRLEAEVTLIERDGIARHSSSRNPGGLNPMHGTGIPGPMHEFALQSLRLHKENWQEIGRLSGKEFSPKFAPRIHLAFDPSDLGPLEKIHAIHAAAPGFSARWIERDELLALEPGLNPAVLRGVWTEGNAKVAAGAYSEAIARAAVAHGAKILQDEVIGLG
ncbi:FAD-dependent oxidoreductase, partial [Candidatus Sumerlaeota bacterium]|nr:FAD-dependent oxidoreductase [Candidatus Sumerlaeota bacterium]